MQSACGFQIVQFLTKSVSQACETPDCLTHRHVMSFDVAGGYMPHVRPTVSYFYYGFHHRRGRIAACCVMLPIVSEEFYYLREVSLPGEHVFNSLTVEVESVGADLETMLFCDAITQRRQELVGCLPISLANCVRRNQLRFRVNGDKDPSITDLGRILSLYVTLFLAYKGPNFVTLNVLAAKVSQLRFHQAYAALPGENEQPHNCVPVQLRDSFGGTDAGAFKKKLNRQECLIFRYDHGAKESHMIFGVILGAFWAFVLLEAVGMFTVLAAFDIASLAIHVTKLQQALAVCQ